MGWMLVLGGRIVYPALLPFITATFDIDYSTAGLLIGALWASYAVLQFPSGVLTDGFGERRVLTLSLAVSAVAVVALVAAPAFAAFVAATVVLGVGNGLYGTARITVLSNTYPEMDTTAISINQASGNVGNAVLPVVAGVVAAALGWRMGFGYLLPLFAIATLGVWVFVPEPTSSASGTDSLRATMGDVGEALRSRPVLVAAAVLFLLTFLYQSVTGFMTTYLVEAKGLSPGTASTLYGVFFASAIVVQFVSGLVADRFGQRVATSGSLALSVPAFALLPAASGIVDLLGVVVLLSCLLGTFPPANAYAVRTLPPEVQGSGYGLLRMLYMGFGATGPPLIGVLADAGLFDEAFYFLGGLALLAVLISQALPTVPRAS